MEGPILGNKMDKKTRNTFLSEGTPLRWPVDWPLAITKVLLIGKEAEKHPLGSGKNSSPSRKAQQHIICFRMFK